MLYINKLLHSCGAIILKLTEILVNFVRKRLNGYVEIDRDNHVQILHHSEHFLVLHKPYDMFINSDNPDRKHTLQSELRNMLPDLANPKLCHEFHFVHRLDYVTSGVICIALNKPAARAASTAFESRTAKKFYLALVHGHVEQHCIVIDKAIGDDTREKQGNHKMCTDDSAFCEKPRKSCTVLLVLERGSRSGVPATKVLLCPGTGRRHQLRVHCSHIGHTIIGDYTYSQGKDVEPHRTFLHSYRLILENELEKLDITSRDPFVSLDPKNQWVPKDLVRALDKHAFLDIHKLIQ